MNRHFVILLWSFFTITIVSAQTDTPTNNLLSACQSNNLAAVQESIAQGADLNAKDQAGSTPLLYAVSAGNPEMTELLLKSGAQLNVNDSQGNCPVILAVQKGNVEVLKKLAASGGDLGHRHIMMRGVVQTPLQAAVQKEDLQMVRYLLSEKVSTETRDIDGQSALMLAAGANNLEMVKLLLENGAYLYASRGFGGSLLDSEMFSPPPTIKRYLQQVEQKRLSAVEEPIWSAVLKKDETTGRLDPSLIETYLQEGGDPLGADKDGKTLLHHVAGAGLKNSNLLESLLSAAGMDVNAKDIHGMTPLHIACKRDEVQNVKTLLDYGASVDVRDYDERTPLILLAEYYHSGIVGEEEEVKIAQMLLDNGADVNAADAFGKTPLLCLAGANMDKHLGFTQLLIEHGADLNRQDYMGKTFLHGASEMGTAAMMKLVIEAGANLNCRDYNSRSILKVARYDKQEKIDLFYQYKQDVSVLEAAYYSQDNIVEYLVQQGADINMTTNYDHSATALIIAAKRNDPILVKTILSLGGEINVQDTQGFTALHYAAEYGFDDVVNELLVGKADVAIVNKDGWRAIDLAGANNRYRTIQLFKDSYPEMKVSKQPMVVQQKSGLKTQEVQITEQKMSEEMAKAMLADLAKKTDPNAAQEMVSDQNRMLAEMQKEQRKFLKKGCITNSGNPFHIAVIQGNVKKARQMITAGQNVNKTDEAGILPLNYAVLMENRGMVTLLLENGADVNGLDSNVNFGEMAGVMGYGHTVGEKAGWGAIHYATVFGSEKMLEFLISKGADLDLAEIEYGESSIFMTVDVDRPEMLKLLINAGADINFKNKQGETMLHSMARRGKVDYIKRLLSLGADIDTGKPGKTPLMTAARAGEEDAMIFLLENGADINILNGKAGDIISSLLPASYTTETLRILIEYGIDINAKNSKGQPPLFCLFNYGGEMNIGLRNNVQLLLDSGWDVNATNKEGDTILHYAARQCSFELAQLMIAHGVNVNAVNDEGETPLDIMFGPVFKKPDYDKLFCLLAENNTHLNDKDRYGRNALHNAVRKGNAYMVTLLASKGADLENHANDMQGGGTPLHTAVSEKHTDVVKALLEAGADVSALDRDQRTPLFTAVLNANVEIIRVLLEAGADVSALNKQQRTPLFTAVQNGNVEIIQLLLDYQADCNAQDKYGTTPLLEAVQYGKIEAIKLLLEAGARTDIPNHNNMTALKLAEIINKPEMMELFQ